MRNRVAAWALALICLLAAGAARAEAVWVREDWQQLTGEYDCGGVRLSGGQAQRLALARTLCHRKPVMILDDPFSALDKQTEAQVFAHLKELARDSIVLLISHRLYLFPQTDQVIFLDHGQALVSTHAQLLQSNAEYARLFHEQEGGASNEK